VELSQSDAATNVPPEPRPRFNEAELVREHKAGEDAFDESDDVAPVLAEPGPPTVTDPTLAHALDLLKSLAVMAPTRPG
jgi:hypothetical protein